jgi:uncharacterized DUF497 family protein
MEIIWDPEKHGKLKQERGIDLDEIKLTIQNNQYLDILKHPSRTDQIILVIKYKFYIHLVVAKIEPNILIIKTCYPSRKANRKYNKEKS